MKTKGKQNGHVNVVTLGCSKNIYDSEVLMNQLRANDMEVTHEDPNGQASTVIINTCGFIDNAKEESVETILQYAEAKKAGEVDKVYVTGCLSERYHQQLEQEIPEVDAWFGTRDLPRLLKTMKADYKHELVGERLLTTPMHYAYMKISEGCDRPCSFCAIPLMRGGHRSYPIEELEQNARSLAAQGVQELILIAQDLTYYGLDIYKKRNLAELLQRLSAVEGIRWIRLQYAFPTGFPLDILEVIRDSPKICNYLDMPLQHISTRMLKAMRRGTTREKTIHLIDRIRQEVPGIHLRTTLITGYPGESEADFNEMLEWVRTTRFERLGVFPYSHEEDTHAYQFEDDVSDETKKERAQRIMDLQQDISLEINEEKVGRHLDVMVDREEGGYYVGRTQFDSPEVDNEVLIPKNEENHLRVGDMNPVRITEADHYDLYGVPVLEDQ